VPTNVNQLIEYLRDKPWLRLATGTFAGYTFKGRVDPSRMCIWQGKTATFIALGPISHEHFEITFDETGFTVDTFDQQVRYEYTHDPDKPCPQPTPTRESIPAGT
jgi:hypothetical protein